MRPAPTQTRRSRSLGTIFLLPLLVGLASLAGLISGLAGDGLADLLSWTGLAVPVIAILWALSRCRR